jgi:hypothetical protein
MLIREYPDAKVLKDSLTKIKDVLRVIGQTDTTKLVDFNRMQALQGRLEGRVNILQPHRFVVHEEVLVIVDDDDIIPNTPSSPGLKTLLVGSSPTKVHVVLFNDALLTASTTSPRSDAPLIFERFMPLDGIKLLEPQGSGSRPSSASALAVAEMASDPFTRILKIETFGFTYTFRCTSYESRERWIELISQHQLPLLLEVAKRQQLISRTPSKPLSSSRNAGSSSASVEEVPPKVGLTASLSTAQSSAFSTAARLSRRIEPASVREMFAGTMTWGKKSHMVLEIIGKMQSEKVLTR